MRKSLAVIGIVFLLGMVFLPLVSASYVCPAAYYEGSTLGWYDRIGLTGVHPSDDSDISAAGIAFTANSTAYLYNVTVDLKRTGTPSAFLIATLNTVGGGTVGTNAYPSSTILDTSTNYISAMDVQGSYSAFTFQFTGTYELQNASTYTFVVKVYNGTINSSNKVEIGGYNPDVEASVNYFIYGSSMYGGYPTDIYFLVNGDTEVDADPSPTAAPTSAPSGDGDLLLEDWTDIIVDWIIPLLLVLVPAFLGLKFLGQTGFVIGLNVGVILCVATNVTDLWTVILIGVADIVFIYSTRG